MDNSGWWIIGSLERLAHKVAGSQYPLTGPSTGSDRAGMTRARRMMRMMMFRTMKDPRKKRILILLPGIISSPQKKREATLETRNSKVKVQWSGSDQQATPATASLPAVPEDPQREGADTQGLGTLSPSGNGEVRDSPQGLEAEDPSLFGQGRSRLGKREDHGGPQDPDQGQ